ncbi:MAG: hypothetical protein JXQ90_12290 [Cyclobacteriaceae bacterium]
MKLTAYSLVALVIVLFISSCGHDLGKATVTYTRATAQYGDVESLRNTPLAGPVRSINDAGKIFVSDQILLIGEEGEGIHVLDNTDPKNPTHTLFINIPGNREFFVQGDILFAESVYDMLKIDISDISNPYLVTRIEEGVWSEIQNQQGETLLGFEYERVTEEIELNDNVDINFWNSESVHYYDYANNLIPPSALPSSFAGNNSDIGSVNRIAYLNDHVYLISKSNMNVFSDAAQFELVSQNSVGWEMETIYPLGDKLYIGSRSSMTVFNATAPWDPRHESEYWHETSCDPVMPVSSETAYLTLRSEEFGDCPGDINALHVLGMRDGWIEQLHEIEMESPFGMTIVDNELFVGEGSAGLKVFDISDVRNPVLTRTITTVAAYDIIAHPVNKNMILIAGPEGFSQFQVGNDFELQLLSTISY